MDEDKKPLSQTERNKRWQEKNKDRSRYLRNRSAARGFLKNQATLEDLQELEGLMKERYATLEKESNE